MIFNTENYTNVRIHFLNTFSAVGISITGGFTNIYLCDFSIFDMETSKFDLFSYTLYMQDIVQRP